MKKRIIACMIYACVAIFIAGCGAGRPAGTSPSDEGQNIPSKSKADTITLDLAFGSRTGEYSGELKDGVPDGYGTFTTENDAHQKWTYEGMFQDGHFQGEGKTTWGNGACEIGTYQDDIIVPMRGEEIAALYSDTARFKYHCVELSGKVFGRIDRAGDVIGFQIWADPVNYDKNTIIYVFDPEFQIQADDYVHVIGIVQDSFEGENAFGAAISAPAVNASKYEILSYMDAVHPALKTVEVAKTQEQHGYAVTVTKVEFAEKETRVYVQVQNHGEASFSLYDFNAKISQNGRQFEPGFNYEGDYPEIQTDLLPGNTTEGIIVFPAIEQASFNLFLEGHSDNFMQDFEPYQFEIGSESAN